MELDEQYPKTHRSNTRQLNALLKVDPDLDVKAREEIAMTLNVMADKACDLEDIVQRLLHEPHSPKEIAELLIAFELTTEQIRGHSETIDGKLYDIAERIKEASKRRRPAATNSKRKRATA